MRLSKVNLSIAVLIIFHIVGLVGVLLGFSSELLSLTPLNLLLTCLIILINHDQWKRWWIFLLTYIVGYGIEVIGVQTGWPFGAYAYGPVLGAKLFDTPLMIGVNWFILLYAANGISSFSKLSFVTRSLFAATLMVLIDYFIEPVAIAYDFWTWFGEEPPLSNYIAWFAIAFVLSMFWQGFNIRLNRTIAIAVYAVEFVFFGFLLLSTL